MLTWVIGFPAGSYTGFAFTSIFEKARPGRSAPTGAFVGVSFLTVVTGNLVVVPSAVPVLCGMFRISLYFCGLKDVLEYIHKGMEGQHTGMAPIDHHPFSL